MKRYPVVIGATVAGLAGVLTFHSHPAAEPSTSSSGTSAVGASGSTTTAPPGSTTPSTSRPSSTTPATSKTATGALEQYRYGELSVKVTVSGGKVIKDAVANLVAPEPRSQLLDDDAFPTLQREVLRAQSARIDAVSGATYTSEAYAQSVQSALDKLRN